MTGNNEQDERTALGEVKDYSILAQAFLENCISVAKLSLVTGKALILKSEYDKEIENTEMLWSDLVSRYERRRMYPPDQEILRSLTLEKLKNFGASGEDEFSVEARCKTIGQYYDFQWVEISAKRIARDPHIILVTTRDINETKLMRKIVDLFVYQNYDYLYLIDAKNDSYIRFTGNKGNTPVPPEGGDHYTEDMIRYNMKYVAPEECERVTASMQLPHVMKMLKNTEVYSFSSGGVTKDGRYRRSRVLFLYYDKSANLILSARTDVTQIYLEEQEKNRQLAEALRNAQHDSMTGIYNQKATAELVKQSLESQYRNTAAILFVDVDNFKMVNDNLGHQKGDELLCFLARRISEIAERDGIAGRLGGDEYLLYLPNILSDEEAEQKAEQICHAFDGFSDEMLYKIGCSCSVGIAIYPRDGTDYYTLLQKADQALYTSKRYGKNRYFLYSCETVKALEQSRKKV